MQSIQAAHLHLYNSKMKNSIKERRTVRKFSNKPVPESLIHELLETAFRAPTMGNMQLYSVVITQDEAKKKDLATAHFNQPMVAEAPYLLTFCADFNRVTQWCDLRNAHAGYDNFQSFLNAFSDALLVLQTFTVLAEAEGLGTCYLGTALYNPEQIIEKLGLPTLVFPIAALSVGYPQEYPSQVERLPAAALIHKETYQAYDAQRIEDIYKEKEALEVNREFVRINKVETLAQVFADIRYKKTDNEYFSEKLLNVLKQQGFLK